MRYVDKLNQLLRNYNSALNGLKEVEKKLLYKKIQKLNKQMDKGVHNHNWFSLSINEYIKECNNAIEKFIDVKTRVIIKAQNIEEKVLNIENSQIIRQIDFDRKSAMDITEFSEFFEKYREKQIQQLVKDYREIGDVYLKNIQENTVKVNEGQSHEPIKEMEKYYEYWERRIFNAITKMIVRALAANKTLFTRKTKPYLIKMTSSYNHPEITFHPTKEELRTQLEKFSSNILDSTQSFGRWWRGFCTVFEEKTNDENAEKYIPYTFYDDVMQNKMVTQLGFDIIHLRNQISERFDMLVKGWKQKMKLNELFDKNQMVKLQKQMEKNQNTSEIEKAIVSFQFQKHLYIQYPNEQMNYFVLIDNAEVKQASIDKVDEWLSTIGDILMRMATTELRSI